MAKTWEQIPTVCGHPSVSTDWKQRKQSRIPLRSILKPCSTHLLQCLLVMASSIDRSVRPTSLNERMTDHSIVLQTNCRHPTLTARLPLRRLPLSIRATSSSSSATLSIILPLASLLLHPSDQHVAPQVRLSLRKHVINFWGDRMLPNATLLFPGAPKYSFSPGLGYGGRPRLDVSFY